MAGDTVPLAASHRGPMSYERPGAGRDFAGAAGCRRAFARGAAFACFAGFAALGVLALRGPGAGRGGCAPPAAGRGADAGTGTGPVGSGAASAAPTVGSRTNGRAAAVGSRGCPAFPAGAGAGCAASGAGAGAGRTVTHPEAMTSAASVRGRARRSCIGPACRTGAARAAPITRSGDCGPPTRNLRPETLPLPPGRAGPAGGRSACTGGARSVAKRSGSGRSNIRWAGTGADGSPRRRTGPLVGDVWHRPPNQRGPSS